MLSKEQVSQISRIIKEKGLNSFYLEEELVDYISCEVEDEIQSGKSFTTSLEEVLARIEGDEISKIQRITTRRLRPNSIDMFQNYLKIALRNFAKHRANSFVNVIGLLLALTSVLIIGLYVNNEYAYDQSFADADRIFRVNGTSYMGDTPSSSNYTSPLLVHAVLEEIPEIEFAASGLAAGGTEPMKIEGKNYYDIRIDYFKEDVFQIFDIKLKRGDIKAFENQPFGVMISEKFAQDHFGGTNPMGKLIEGNIYGKDHVFTIIGVFEDIPQRSHLSYGPNGMEVIGTDRAWEIIGGGKGSWNSTHMPAYIKIAENADYKEVEKKIDELVIRRAGEDIFYRHYLQPITDVHLNTLNLPTDSRGDLKQVVTFGLIGLLILSIACINYVNLATARITVRMKEVGVRKVLGADRKQFLFQFIVEAFILTTVSLLVAIGLVALSLNYLNSVFALTLSFELFSSWKLIVALFTVLFLVSVISGGYPGQYLSRMGPTHLLKSTVKIGKSKISIRKVLVVFQFGISAAIIICTIVVVNQLNFLRKSSLGYDEESIVYISMPYTQIASKGPVFKDALATLPAVKSSAFTKGSLARGNFSGNRIKIGTDEEGSMQRILPVDFEYLDAMGMEMAEGRWFDPELATDVDHGFVVNEAFLRYFNLTEPIGQKMSRNEQTGEIIGVIKDFHWKSKHNEIEPLVMFMTKDYVNRYGNMVVKLNPGNITQTRQQLEGAWESVFWDRPFEVEFLDEQLNQVYEKDRIFGDIFSSFSLIAIAISCLGLLGLVSFSVERRFREIGVRKVLGASVSSILLLISKDFSRLVLIGFILSIPAAYYFIGGWLENFEYRIELGYWPFVLACLITICIAWASVSFISLKAARANPVDSLRSE